MGRFSMNPFHFCGKAIRKAAHVALVSVISAAFIIAPFPQSGPTEAHAGRGDRTLWLHFTHTGEEKKITFRRNGKYDPAGIKELQWIVRDWRRNEATKMDPRLFDLVWSIYQEAGATKAIRVVSGFRSKKTNDKLRRRSRGVAKTSQHTAGRAMDFYIPGVPVKRLREIGLKMQVGGVGYYPGSKTPFVHMDTGNVRHWPRMTPKQVARLFPDGKTLHKDTRGRHAKGYAAALNDYKKRQTKVIQPLSKSKRTRIASNEKKQKKNGGLLAGLFNGNKKPKKPKVIASSVAKPTVTKTRPAVAAASKASAITPTIISNKPAQPDTTPIPSRIGRPDPVVPDPVVVAQIPAPRAVPSELREQFAPAQSIVIAEAPSPIVRPASTQDVPVADQPQVIVAKANIPPESLPRPRAIDTTKTAALTRKDFDVPTPQVVKNRLANTPDPTRLVLNDKLTNPVESASTSRSNTTLAYANETTPEDNLPQLDAREFNSRFGQVQAKNSDVNQVPTKVIKDLTAAERFAALEIQEEKSTFSLDDIGIKSNERKLALRKSLGFLKSDDVTTNNQPIEVASIEPNTPPIVSSALADAAIRKTPQLQKQAVTKKSASKPQQKARSLTNATGAFAFDGERKQVVRTLLTDASMFDVTVGNLELPKPNHMPSLFVQPIRAFAGSFSTANIRVETNGFTGDAITITPTLDFERASKVRLGWLSR
ncbi:MAG: DUF882 domain-containing protein [Hyphomicrobiales bacterium]